MSMCVDVYEVLQCGKTGAGPLVSKLDFVGAAYQARLIVHPDQGGFELVGHFQRLLGARQYVAS